MKTPLRRRLAGPALLLLVPMLAACGFGAQTDQIYQPAVGTNNRSGQVDVLNALIVSATNGTGTFAGTLVNNSQTRSDQLVSVTEATKNTPVVVAAGGHVNLADSGIIRLRGSNIIPGAFVTLTFQFASGQTTTMDMPVVAHAGDYINVPVNSTASATASPSATPTS